MRLTKLGIVADDITGLQGVAGEFRRFGFHVATFLDPRQARFPDGIDIVCVDTNSRVMERPEAEAAVRNAVLHLRELGVNFFFKQADTGLHGHVAAEGMALARAAGSDRIVYCPASPTINRVTRRGRQQLASDHSCGEERLDVDLRTVWQDRRDWEIRFGRAPDVLREPAGNAIWVCDAENEEDLDVIMFSALEAGIWTVVGGVDLARSMAHAMWAQGNATSSTPALVVAGSLQGQAKRQVEFLRRAGVCEFIELTVEAPDGDIAPKSAARIVETLSAGRHCTIVPNLHPAATAASTETSSYPFVEGHIRAHMQALLIETISKVLDQAGPKLGGLVVAGGSTSELLFRNVLAASTLTRLEHLSEGVTGAVLTTDSGRHLPVVTKAGNWGDTDVLAKGIQWIAECSAGPGRQGGNDQ